MTYRQILCSLKVGEIFAFETLREAISASSQFCKFYNGMRFKRAGCEVVRVA